VSSMVRQAVKGPYARQDLRGDGGSRTTRAIAGGQVVFPKMRRGTYQEKHVIVGHHTDSQHSRQSTQDGRTIYHSAL